MALMSFVLSMDTSLLRSGSCVGLGVRARGSGMVFMEPESGRREPFR